MAALLTKVTALLLLKIYGVYMAISDLDPIVFKHLLVPANIDLVKVGFGKGFYQLDRMVFNGTILEQPDEFSINLLEDGLFMLNANIQLHYNARFQSKLVVRNTWIKNKGWGHEDISGSFPFKAGEAFILEFLALPKNVIQISVNYKFFTFFHNSNLSKITQLYITGIRALRINSLTLYPNELKPTIKTEAPSTSPSICPNPNALNNVPVPSTIDLVKIGFGRGFKANTRLIFKGVPLKGTNQMIIDFGDDGNLSPKNGGARTANLPLHFNSRFKTGLVHTSSWVVYGGWDVEHIYGNPFKVGEPFILEFFASPRDLLYIYVNNKYFATVYYYGLKGYHDLKNVSQLYIEGFRLDSLIKCQ